MDPHIESDVYVEWYKKNGTNSKKLNCIEDLKYDTWQKDEDRDYEVMGGCLHRENNTLSIFDVSEEDISSYVCKVIIADNIPMAPSGNLLLLEHSLTKEPIYQPIYWNRSMESIVLILLMICIAIIAIVLVAVKWRGRRRTKDGPNHPDMESQKLNGIEISRVEVNSAEDSTLINNLLERPPENGSETSEMDQSIPISNESLQYCVEHQAMNIFDCNCTTNHVIARPITPCFV